MISRTPYCRATCLALLIAIALLPVPAKAQSEAPLPAEETAAGKGIEKLVLRRRFSEGQVFSYAAVARTYRQTVVSTMGAVIEEDLVGMRCEIAAALVIDSVRADGRPRQMSLRVFRLVIREGFIPPVIGAEDDISEPFEHGTELQVSYPEEGAGPPSIEILGGEELAPNVESALRLVLPESAGTRDDDLMFGREGAVKVGDRWGIAREETAQALREGGLEVDPERLEGEVELRSAEPDAGRYEVGVELRGARAGVPLPKGYATRSGMLNVKLSTTLPVDPGQPPFAERSEYTLRSEALGREDDTLVAVDIAFFQARSARYRRVGAR